MAETRSDDLVLEYIESGEQHIISSIEVHPSHQPGMTNVTLHCDDGHSKHMSLMALINMSMGGRIFHGGLRMLISRS